MKIAFSKPIVDLSGNGIAWKEGLPATLGVVAVESLLAPTPQGRPNVSAKDSLDRYALARRIHESGDEEISVTVEEIAILKAKIVDNPYTDSPLIVAQALTLLEGE